jgi:hypothetical protein
VNVSENKLRDPGKHDELSGDVRAGQGWPQLPVAMPSEGCQHIAEGLGRKATTFP